MSETNGSRPPLHVIEGGRSPRGSSTASKEREADERLAAIIARGASTVAGDGFGEELARSYLAKATEATPAKADPLDPLGRHAGPAEPTQPASALLEGVLDAVPRLEPGALPSPASSGGPALGEALSSPQAGYRKRGGASRAQRDARRARRRAHDRVRLAKVREEIFARYGQVADVPDFPALQPAVYGLNLRVMRDGSGRQACEVLSKLPLTQQMALCQLGHAALPLVRAKRACAFTRGDLARAPALPTGAAELRQALETIRTEVAPTIWFRRLVCAAFGHWAHRGQPLSKEARQAFRGGVYVVEGFCQNALSWLVPRPDGTPYTRSVLWGPNGPFALLGAAARRLGRRMAGEAGAGLWTRWQPPAGKARFKGPTRKSPTGATERFALGLGRYDEAMAGRTAKSLAKRARGQLRELARVVVSALTPWVELPQKRSRKGPTRPEDGLEAPREAVGAPTPPGARAPP